MTLSEADLIRNKRLRVGLLVISAVSCFFFAGASLGWGPMQLILEENQSFFRSCVENDNDEEVCYDSQQRILMRMGLVIPLMQILSPLFAMLEHKIGGKRFAYTQAGLILVSYAMIILGLRFYKAEAGLLFLGFALVGTSTWFQNILIVIVGLYFEGHNMSRVIFILNVFFDSGTLTWLFMWYIKRWTNLSSVQTMCILFGFATLVYGLSVYFWRIAVPVSEEKEDDDKKQLEDEPVRRPSSMYSTLDLRMSTAEIRAKIQKNQERHSKRFSASVENISKRISFLQDGVDGPARISKMFMTSTNEETDTNNEDRMNTTDYVIVADREPKAQLRSKPFLLLVAFFGLNVGCNWNTVTQKDFLASLGDDETGHLYLTIFTLISPLSLLGAPLVDKLLLNYGWIAAFQTVNGLSVLYQVIKISSNNLNVQIAAFVAFSFYRSFFFGITFGFLPTLMGNEAIGRAAAILNFALGIMGIPGIFLVPIVVENNSFFVASLFFLILTIPCIISIHLLGKCIRIENEAKEKKLELKNSNMDMGQFAVLVEELDEEDEKELDEE